MSSPINTRRILRELGWAIPHVIVYTLGMVALGALLGSLLFPLIGSLLGMKLTVSEMIVNGARDGGFYFFMWGFGLAIVYTAMQIHDRVTGQVTIPWRRRRPPAA